MRASLLRKVAIFRSKSNIKSTVWVSSFRFDMKMLRTPIDMQKYFPNRDFSKPDRKPAAGTARVILK
jgi:hypothetical protein